VANYLKTHNLLSRKHVGDVFRAAVKTTDWVDWTMDAVPNFDDMIKPYTITWSGISLPQVCHSAIASRQLPRHVHAPAKGSCSTS
jgi:hypothetical protein